jgi:Domain of unknown function (DUF1992)
MLIFDFLAEQKIAEAVSRGELDDLPGAGRPLECDDDPLIAEDLRLAYRMLKNPGFVLPQVQALNEIRDLERLLQAAADVTARGNAVKKLALLKLSIENAYYGKALERLGRMR